MLTIYFVNLGEIYLFPYCLVLSGGKLNNFSNTLLLLSRKCYKLEKLFISGISIITLQQHKPSSIWKDRSLILTMTDCICVCQCLCPRYVISHSHLWTSSNSFCNVLQFATLCREFHSNEVLQLSYVEKWSIRLVRIIYLKLDPINIYLCA